MACPRCGRQVPVSESQAAYEVDGSGVMRLRLFCRDCSVTVRAETTGAVKAISPPPSADASPESTPVPTWVLRLLSDGG